jgi:hypothetical protein
VGTASRKIAAASNLFVAAIDVDPKQIEAARSGAVRPNLQNESWMPPSWNLPMESSTSSHLAWPLITSPIGSERFLK